MTVLSHAPTPPTCIFFVKGTCKKADNCLYSHSLPSNGDSNSTDEDMPVDYENSTLCSICYEVPETFGLLLNCSHIFCLNCARKWRNKGSKDGALAESNAIKECALCRSKSTLLVPSTSFPRSQQEKDDIVLKYRAKMALIPCKYYKRSSNPQRKRCPFADDCLFGHFDGNGNKVTGVRRPTPKRGDRLVRDNFMEESIQNGPLGDMLDRLRTLTDFLNDGVGENEHRVGNLRILSDTLEMVANLRPRFHAAHDELEDMIDHDVYYDDHENDEDDEDEYYTTEEEMDYDTVD
ncbi:hypothetical protein HDU79_004210 [Rhizoclosmatium sp. JEL0117]|nr:hypothetical protein HDU79_004210 [Rhizoclosmatium sp. JEL0117]